METFLAPLGDIFGYGRKNRLQAKRRLSVFGRNDSTDAISDARKAALKIARKTSENRGNRRPQFNVASKLDQASPADSVVGVTVRSWLCMIPVGRVNSMDRSKNAARLLRDRKPFSSGPPFPVGTRRASTSAFASICENQAAWLSRFPRSGARPLGVFGETSTSGISPGMCSSRHEPLRTAARTNDGALRSGRGSPGNRRRVLSRRKVAAWTGEGRAIGVDISCSPIRCGAGP